MILIIILNDLVFIDRVPQVIECLSFLVVDGLIFHQLRGDVFQIELVLQQVLVEVSDVLNRSLMVTQLLKNGIQELTLQQVLHITRVLHLISDALLDQELQSPAIDPVYIPYINKE